MRKKNLEKGEMVVKKGIVLVPPLLDGTLFLTNNRLYFSQKIKGERLDINLKDVLKIEKNKKLIFPSIKLTLYNFKDIEMIKFKADQWINNIKKEKSFKEQNHKTYSLENKNDIRNCDFPKHSEKIRNILREYENQKKALCLDCGYEGLMGVEYKKTPWYVSWPILILFILTGVGFFVAFGLGFLRSKRIKYFLRCPNCNHVIGPVRF